MMQRHTAMQHRPAGQNCSHHKIIGGSPFLSNSEVVMLSRDLVDMPDHGADRGPREAATVWEAATRSYSVSWVCISSRRALPAKTAIHVPTDGPQESTGSRLGRSLPKEPKGWQTNPRSPLGRTGISAIRGNQGQSGCGGWASFPIRSLTFVHPPLHKTFPVYLCNSFSVLCYQSLSSSPPPSPLGSSLISPCPQGWLEEVSASVFYLQERGNSSLMLELLAEN
jgi:hypothetical protein